MSRKRQTNQLAMPIDIDELIAAIREEPDGLTIREIGEIFELGRGEQKAVTLLLSQLQGAGLLRKYGQEFRWSESGRAMIGTIRRRRRKTINFIPDDPAQRTRGGIRIDSVDLNGAFDGDRVIVSLARKAGGKDREGRVETILKRGQLKVIGRLHHGYRESWVESLDEKFSYDIDVDGEKAADFADGWIVQVEVTSYPYAHNNPRGKIINQLGSSTDETGIDIEIVIHKHDLPNIFPHEVLAEAEAALPVVTEEQIKGRLDLREVPTVTIDGETARDFDDAISLHKLENGNFELGVHIADVSFYVRDGSPLDQEARLRGTSVYFPERAIPMLPEKLSNGICSLNPKVDRLTMSAMMEVDRRGRVVDYRLRESVIRSSERMTYTDVNKLLAHSDPQLAMRYAGLLELFSTMEELARILIKMRGDRGAIDFNLPESIFEFDDEGRIAGVLRADRNIAHRIIEEFMLLANETVAGHFLKLGIPSIYRIHEPPEPQRVIEFAELAQAYGYRFPFSDVSAHDYQRLSHQLSGKPEERVLAFSMLRSLQRARYDAQNCGHFGLAASVYTHFTSPIRRYPDLIVHRVLRGLLQRSETLGNKAPSITAGSQRKPPIPLQNLELIAVESSERERAADAAEKEVDEWRKARFMAERIGEEFDGMIINVRDFGFFVELEEFFIEGLVQVSSLIDDYYNFDERTHSLIGRRGKRTFRLGDRLRVRVDKVNVDRHLVDFSVATQNRLPNTRKKQKKQK